jgi:hypothetical protein
MMEIKNKDIEEIIQRTRQEVKEEEQAATARQLEESCMPSGTVIQMNP